MFYKKFMFTLFVILACNTFTEKAEESKEVDSEATTIDLVIGVTVIGGGVGLVIITAPVVAPAIVTVGTKAATAAVAAKSTIMANAFAIKATYYTTVLLKGTSQLTAKCVKKKEANYLNKLINEDNDLDFEEKLAAAFCSNK